MSVAPPPPPPTLDVSLPVPPRAPPLKPPAPGELFPVAFPPLPPTQMSSAVVPAGQMSVPCTWADGMLNV
jgi:hypothetical protein